MVRVEDGSGPRAEILWDVYDVPHIFAASHGALFHAFGWAQMRNHRSLLLRLYGQARGRAAEYWGASQLRADRRVHLLGIPERARRWVEAQSPAFRGHLDMFVAGINDYAAAHADEIAAHLRVVLPITVHDVVAHCQRVLLSFVVDVDAVIARAAAERRPGSNAWAIGAARTAHGHALLLSNPHMPWGDVFRCFEAHLEAPGVRAYGIALVGFPVLVMAFNDALGWSHTVNAHQGWTLYELEPADDGYLFDGAPRAFEHAETRLVVKQPDGALVEETLRVRSSIHGPIIDERDGRAFALRVAGLDRPRALEQWWTMACAADFSAFDAALRQMQLPMLSVIYADRDDHIMHLFNGQVPIRRPGDAGNGRAVPGNVSATLWTETHGYADLPRVVDPASGWLHNANDPPWTTTFPRAIDPADYPPYIAPRGPMTLRAQRSAAMLIEHDKLAFADVVRCKYSTIVELAARVLDELIAAAGASRAAAALAAWDRRVDADSRGAVLFAHWVQGMAPERMFAVPWDERDPLATPRGLADPAEAAAVLEARAAVVEARFGALDVPWGDVFQLRSATTTLPAIGADGMGVFSELWFWPTTDGRMCAIGGDCFTAVVELSNPVRAMALMPYGNSTEAPRDDQLRLFAAAQLRPVWLTKPEILDHLGCRERT